MSHPVRKLRVKGRSNSQWVYGYKEARNLKPFDEFGDDFSGTWKEVCGTFCFYDHSTQKRVVRIMFIGLPNFFDVHRFQNEYVKYRRRRPRKGRTR